MATDLYSIPSNCPKCGELLPKNLASGRIVCRSCGWSNKTKAPIKQNNQTYPINQTSLTNAVNHTNQLASDQRLHTQTISSLKNVRWIGYIFAFFTFFWAYSFGASPDYQNQLFGIIFATVVVAVEVIFIQLSTGVFVAIIDLLSRIELNTRNQL